MNCGVPHRRSALGSTRAAEEVGNHPTAVQNAHLRHAEQGTQKITEEGKPGHARKRTSLSRGALYCEILSSSF